MLEEVLVRYGVPYQVIGGPRFYERREVKDVLAYLRVLVNPADEVALKRIINVPKRGIGSTTIGHLERAAEAEGEGLLRGAALGRRTTSAWRPGPGGRWPTSSPCWNGWGRRPRRGRGRRCRRS